MKSDHNLLFTKSTQYLALTKTNQNVKYESPVIKSFKNNARKTFGLPTDRRTGRLIDYPTDRGVIIMLNRQVWIDYTLFLHF